MHCTLLSLQRLSPWVGLRKINVSYWAWEDMSPFTNTSLQWLPGEPSDSGFCAYLERARVAGLKANPCTSTTDGLICEKPVGETEWREHKQGTLQLKEDSTISIGSLCNQLCSAGPKSPSARPCKTPCSLRTSCANCTSQPAECMWCSSTQRCVDSSAYVISFPYGQCLEWQTQDCTGETSLLIVWVSSQPKDDAFWAYELFGHLWQWFIVYEILFNKTNVSVFRHSMEGKAYSCDSQKHGVYSAFAKKKKKHHWLLVS